MSLKWTGDDDTLSMGMSSGSGFDHESLQKTHKGEFKKRGKQEKRQSLAAADQAHATRKAADTQRAVQFGQSIAQAALMGAQVNAGKAGKAAKLGERSEALDVKREAALAAGDKAKAAKLGERSIKLSTKAQKVGMEADPLWGARGEGEYIAGTQAGQRGRTAPTKPLTKNDPMKGIQDPMKGIQQWQEDVAFEKELSKLTGG
jgi:hypothetical protein